MHSRQKRAVGIAVIAERRSYPRTGYGILWRDISGISRTTVVVLGALFLVAVCVLMMVFA